MPEEPLRDISSGLSYSAYLAEVRSIGGLSGSPVWVVMNPARVRPGSTAPERRLHFYLLGLVRGHWTKEGKCLSDLAEREQDVLNTGIAIVTPIQSALEIIDSREEVARRQRVDEEEVGQAPPPWQALRRREVSAAALVLIQPSGAAGAFHLGDRDDV